MDCWRSEVATRHHSTHLDTQNTTAGQHAGNATRDVRSSSQPGRRARNLAGQTPRMKPRQQRRRCLQRVMPNNRPNFMLSHPTLTCNNLRESEGARQRSKFTLCQRPETVDFCKDTQSKRNPTDQKSGRQRAPTRPTRLPLPARQNVRCTAHASFPRAKRACRAKGCWKYVA